MVKNQRFTAAAKTTTTYHSSTGSTEYIHQFRMATEKQQQQQQLIITFGETISEKVVHTIGLRLKIFVPTLDLLRLVYLVVSRTVVVVVVGSTMILLLHRFLTVCLD